MSLRMMLTLNFNVPKVFSWKTQSTESHIFEHWHSEVILKFSV